MTPNQMTAKHLFKAGEYYVGDPCYAVADDNWSDLIETTGCFGLHPEQETTTNWDSGKFVYNGLDCFADGTKYGDGCYFSNYGHEFGVDAGLLGIIPKEAVDSNSTHGGNFIVFVKDFLVWADDGVFHFGDIEINTGDEPKDEDDWSDEEDWDDDEEGDEES